MNAPEFSPQVLAAAIAAREGLLAVLMTLRVHPLAELRYHVASALDCAKRTIASMTDRPYGKAVAEGDE